MENGVDFMLGLGAIGLIIGLVALLLYIWSIIWSYKDAEKRGWPGILVALMVAFVAWPLSVLLWLLIRPKNYHRTT